MSRRRFHALPTSVLETMVKMRILRWAHLEARAELMTQQIAKDIEDASGTSGPWPCTPPEGMC